MADTDQAQGDSGGSWWDSVAGAASSVANTVAGAAGSAWETGKEVGGEVIAKVPSALDVAAHVGGEGIKDVAEAIPALGAIPGVVAGMGDSDKASDARQDAMLHEDDKSRVAFDNEKDAYYGGKVQSDAISAVAGAIPLVGVAYDAAEIASGAYNAVTGGEGGYKGGTENFSNHVADVADMATAGWKGITGGASDTHVADAGWGARAALQKKYEEDAAARGAQP
jgi:hypothetical protein